MTRVVVIGGSGHIGTALVPRLVAGGAEVVSVTRGQSAPYQDHPAWRSVRRVTADREAEEKAGTFGATILALDPDVVVDLICFTPGSARHLADALAGHVQHLIHIGTIWVHGPSTVVPTPETAPRRPFGDYGLQKAAIEADLLDRARRDDLPVTILHPGHIVGRGWAPLNPAGHFNPAVFETIARGEPLALPNFGLETVHHVHADDVARLVILAMANWSTAVGEAFHAVSPGALTLRGYAEAMYAWFGQPPALTFQSWPEWQASHPAEDAAATLDHIAHSPNCSIVKAERLLGFVPRYTSLDGVQDAVASLIERGVITVPASMAAR